MNGQQLLNATLKINAGFSLLSGIVLLVFDRQIVKFLTGDNHASVFAVGIMLIGFSVFVLFVSMMKQVKKGIVWSIIVMDLLWVLASAGFVVIHDGQLTRIGQLAIVLVALIIAVFAFYQIKGLRQHLAAG